jgi:SAM-dependent methyltransferase
MLQAARAIAPNARLLAAQAERLPFPQDTFPLAAAAGSLNYTHLPTALAEVARTLTPNGRLLIYDFSLGRNPTLDPWIQTFHTRYPKPQGDALPIDKQVLRNHSTHLQLTHFESLEISLSLSLTQYVDYLLTETNIAHALSRGATIEEIRRWCLQMLQPLFASQARSVLFPAYFAVLQHCE